MEGLNYSNNINNQIENIHLTNSNETQTSVIIYLKNFIKSCLDNSSLNKQECLGFIKKITDLVLFKNIVSDKNIKNLCITIEEFMNYKLIEEDSK